MRNLESHMRTVDYFNKLGWTIDYEVFHQRLEIKPSFAYTLYIYPPNSGDSVHVEHCRSLIGLMITASEWLVENVQGGDHSA